MVPVTMSRASARVGWASRGLHVTAVPLATSTSLSANVSKLHPVYTGGPGPGVACLCNSGLLCSPLLCSVWLQLGWDPA